MVQYLDLKMTFQKRMIGFTWNFRRVSKLKVGTIIQSEYRLLVKGWFKSHFGISERSERLEPRSPINLRVADRILDYFPSIMSFNKSFNLQGKMDTFKPVLPFQILIARKDIESSSI